LATVLGSQNYNPYDQPPAPTLRPTNGVLRIPFLEVFEQTRTAQLSVGDELIVTLPGAYGPWRTPTITDSRALEMRSIIVDHDGTVHAEYRAVHVSSGYLDANGRDALQGPGASFDLALTVTA
jgi:hypothetical protein